MLAARIDRSRDLDGGPVVLACFDLSEAEIAAVASAVAAAVSDRFRSSAMAADDGREFRELTALADELAEQARRSGAQTVVLPPARLSALHDKLTAYLESREHAEWLREEDEEALSSVRALVGPLEELRAEAMRAALAPPGQHR